MCLPVTLPRLPPDRNATHRLFQVASIQEYGAFVEIEVRVQRACLRSLMVGLQVFVSAAAVAANAHCLSFPVSL